MRIGIFALTIAALATIAPEGGRAHEVRPGYFALRERDAGSFDAVWKVPARGDQRLAIHPRLPQACRDGERVGRFADGAWLERWTTRCEGGLSGGRIAIDGLEATRTDVLVRIDWEDGASRTTRLTSDAASFTVTGPASTGDVLATYTALGIEHILLGIDHLLFVLALLFLVSSGRRLVATITAFSAAHSLTLSAAALGWVRVPQAPVEATIALSIVFVATEVAGGAAGGAPDLARRRPWLVAFAFGLLHGLGFAGALREVGLPEHAIPLALLGFNVGVELGQLAFVAIVLTLFTAVPRALRNLRARVDATPWSCAAAIARPAAYGIGPVASFWLIERIARFWS